MTLDELNAQLGRSWRDFRGLLLKALHSPAHLLGEQDRVAIEGEIHDGARLTSGYGFLLFSACGIAALGLLQSSVAVVIGAMLISPLMGPILSMGMSLARVEPREFQRAAITLAVGAGLSILASTLIVWASPLKDITSEILARTRPTLLDLVVALLSGFVGAYLTVNRKGGSIAGVAIATALMPPLAVVGYGLATASWPIAGGALLLFLTNVVAILGSVFGVARRYGFRPAQRHGAAWEVYALFAVTVILCVPLALSLRNIVVEARETNRVRSAIERAFADAGPHITDLAVAVDRGKVRTVNCVVVTRRYVSGASASVARALQPGAQVSIEQIVIAGGDKRSVLATNSLGSRPALPGSETSPEQRLRMMLSSAGEVAGIDQSPTGLAVKLVLKGAPSLGDYRAVEQAAQRFLPDTSVAIIPPLMPLPEVVFARGSSTIDTVARQDLATISWALQRWGVKAVRAEGRASPGRLGPRPMDLKMAARRSAAVAQVLASSGLVSVTQSTFVPDRALPDERPFLVVRLSLEAATSPPADAK